MRREVKIGILTLVVFVIFVWGYQFLKGKNVFERNNTYYIRYENVDQLEVASPVLVNGFKVGSVIKIKIDHPITEIESRISELIKNTNRKL